MPDSPLIQQQPVEAGLIQHFLIALLSGSAALESAAGRRVQQPTGTASLLAGPGRAALAFISTGKFYCCNYGAVNCIESSSGKGEQPPAREGTFTPCSAGRFLPPARPGLAPAPAPSPRAILGTSKASEVTLGGFPAPSCGWGPEPSCEGHPDQPDLPSAASPALNPPTALPLPRSGFPVIW